MSDRLPDVIMSRDREARELVRGEFGGVWHDGTVARLWERSKNLAPSLRRMEVVARLDYGY
jgi:hypothetical protein